MDLGFNKEVIKDFGNFKRLLEIKNKPLLHAVEYQVFCLSVAKSVLSNGIHPNGKTLTEQEKTWVQMFIDEQFKNFKEMKEEYKDVIEQDN